MVGDVERSGTRNSVLIVNETHGLRLWICRLASRGGQYDDISTQKVAMAKDEAVISKTAGVVEFMK